MIQRIQTVYWFLAALMACMMLPFEWMQLIVADGDYSFAASGISKVAGNASEPIVNGIPLIIYIIAVALLNLVIIFLYKKRVLQARLTTIAILLSIGLYAVIALYRYMSFTADVISSNLNYPLLFPLVCLFFDYLAQRSVIKDEIKVRSLDRIR
ncbi:MAG: DUF4293 domain-containing protein [Bacteroidales bacterium]|nr:DUF4293 domain-containing protein [Bacteroidales bacterium]